MSKSISDYISRLQDAQEAFLKAAQKIEKMKLNIKNKLGICQEDGCMEHVEDAQTDFCPAHHAQNMEYLEDHEGPFTDLKSRVGIGRAG